MMIYTYKGLEVLYPVSELNTHYLDRIILTMSKALKDYKRVHALRLDLRLPVSDSEKDILRRDEVLNNTFNQKNIIKRFFESLKAKIKAQEKRMKVSGKRIYPCHLRYVWCRERNKSTNDHYHLVLFFNKDRYFSSGYRDNEESLVRLIMDAWSSALGEYVDNADRLVQLVYKGTHYLDQNKYDFENKYQALFTRLSYFAKNRTKHYDEGKRCFGTSQG
ncbi:inovirus Gp2 family protein [Vibrio parahaemolyticus]|uniref:inovirus Gp2 family protein n=8 Tax=Vibrio parahaemolyticus TaxID=670 RepID=UPI000403958D|nr:inovirus Gp2 family protein [Vibrio parahaemolyticus]EHK0751224.1 inovirus Gp2 family protein [Vibrio parahaemolyticus]EJB8527044.1 inovirus Gp2 family protein [Vibrio parahaemolyticus]EJE4156281.1 inovirus Gp2 family protein [Vibrio parahaemolyticus]EJE4185808.1 inovirus Gp2 family protein [Vibrio parahaemolyticus]EJE4206925.1 inovirus Gp2 family protein [Vibrio parahaemolyticus]